jgi:sugar/nucleoside kinase (ribokinase family)
VEKLPEIIGIGEILIDFVALEPGSYVDVSGFLKRLGGAPMNCIIVAKKLGIDVGAITAVGNDPLGDFLINELKKQGVDITCVKRKNARTTITFVANDPETGERTFLFYREPWIKGTADNLLSPDDIDEKYIARAKILHVSGFAMSKEPAREAVLKAVDIAVKNKVEISFDPTLRLDVWQSSDEIKDLYDKVLEKASIATFSKEEAAFVLGELDPLEAAKKALKYGLKIVGIKLGGEGSLILRDSGKGIKASAFEIKPVDTTGAGDAWNAALLVGLLKGWGLEKCILFANAAGAHACMHKGATEGIPTLPELEKFVVRWRNRVKIEYIET